MRVGIVALLQESNTFLPQRTTLAHFEQDLLAEGDAIRARMSAAHHEVGGFFAELDAQGVEAVPLFAARALPFGAVTADAFAELLRRMEAAVRRAGPCDGYLVAPHGATVSEPYPDADGQWLGQLRGWVGPVAPIVGTLDPHANLSPAMVAATDALIAYRTNPHLDQRDRGREAARLLVRTLRGDIWPTQAAAFPPLVVNIERQSTAAPPCRTVLDAADAMLAEPGVLANSFVLGFPYADVPEMGAATLVVTDGDPDLAQRRANDLANLAWELREEFVGRLPSIDAALAQAAQLPGDGPVCLLDMGDNVGGGSPGDATWLAHALAERGPRPAFVCLSDAEAQAAAARAGTGARVRLAMGGRSGPEHGSPFVADVTVRGLFDGKFSESEPRHGGFTHFDQGPTALVETDGGLVVMLTQRRMAPFSLRQLTAFGVDPVRFRVLTAKGVHAPAAAYAPVSRALIRVDTPGATSADLSRLPYLRRRRPLYPFERDATWSPSGTPQ